MDVSQLKVQSKTHPYVQGTSRREDSQSVSFGDPRSARKSCLAALNVPLIMLVVPDREYFLPLAYQLAKIYPFLISNCHIRTIKHSRGWHLFPSRWVTSKLLFHSNFIFLILFFFNNHFFLSCWSNSDMTLKVFIGYGAQCIVSRQ